jgi:RNA polymerase sigma factor (sigma-70 family)
MTEILTYSDLQSVFMEARADLERMLRRRLGSSSSAADLAQDLYFRLRHLTAPLPDRHQARTYLFRMAVNLVTDHMRMEGRRAELLTGAVVLFDDVCDGPERDVLTRDQMLRVEQALSELPPRCRDVLYMSRMERKTHAEIAAALGVPRSLVEKYLIRALRHCRARLSESE